MENFKQQVVNYLNKTAKHTFVFPNGTYFKIIKKQDAFGNPEYWILETSFTFGKPSGYKMTKIDIDWYVRVYKENAKCVLSHVLFLNRGGVPAGLKCIRNTKYVKSEIDQILQPQTAVKV